MSGVRSLVGQYSPTPKKHLNRANWTNYMNRAQIKGSVGSWNNRENIQYSEIYLCLHTKKQKLAISHHAPKFAQVESKFWIFFIQVNNYYLLTASTWGFCSRLHQHSPGRRGRRDDQGAVCRMEEWILHRCRGRETQPCPTHDQQSRSMTNAPRDWKSMRGRERELNLDKIKYYNYQRRHHDQIDH